jgi:hypothetical protein
MLNESVVHYLLNSDWVRCVAFPFNQVQLIGVILLKLLMLEYLIRAIFYLDFMEIVHVELANKR